MEVKAVYLGKILLCSFLVFSFSGCGFVSQQIREKNREEYLLNNPAAWDPQLSKNVGYANLKYQFLSRYAVQHAWPKGMSPCKYSRIQLPKSQQNGYWYGSYKRLGNIFEYNGKTLQERKTNGYPNRSIDLRYLSIDEYVRSDKYVYQGKVKESGLKPICAQTFIGSSHTLTIFLRKWTTTEWVNKMEKLFPDSKFSTVRVGSNNWLVQKSSLKPPGFRRVSGRFESWILPIGDTGYSYYFDLGASTKSLKNPQMHEKMQKIFKHLIESVKIERLSIEEERLASAKVKKLITEIEAYEARRK